MLRNFIFAAARGALQATRCGELTPQAAHEAVARVIRGLSTPIDPQVANEVEIRLLAQFRDRAMVA